MVRGDDGSCMMCLCEAMCIWRGIRLVFGVGVSVGDRARFLPRATEGMGMIPLLREINR